MPGEILTLNYGWSLPENKRLAGDAPVFGSNGIVGFHYKPLHNLSLYGYLDHVEL